MSQVGSIDGDNREIWAGDRQVSVMARRSVYRQPSEAGVLSGVVLTTDLRLHSQTSADPGRPILVLNWCMSGKTTATDGTDGMIPLRGTTVP